MQLLLVLLPLLNSFICMIAGSRLGREGVFLSSVFSLGLSCLLSWYLFLDCIYNGHASWTLLLEWISSGCLTSCWGVSVDPLSTSMLVVVTSVSFLVHVYSSEYMQSDPHVPRFFSCISLFTFFMLALVTASGFLQLFFGWEGVGLCSYLLISFWHTRVKAGKAALKAVLVNRVADVFLFLGLAACFATTNTLNIDTLITLGPWQASQGVLWFKASFNDFFCTLLFLGAMGKSAQLGLHTWLPDAMEGPTPVSALIHAATMVTAGVFLLVKCSPLFEYSSWTLSFVSIVGSLTAFFAATVALVQHDIKRVIAYSTCSQLGYMFFSCGLSGYEAGLFHLFNHAFFKALLFLSAGCLIHASNDEQDMRNLGGTANLLPITYTCVLIGSLSLSGFPFLSGYYSKDFILEIAAGSYADVGLFAYWIGTVTAFLTAFYSMRVLWLSFAQKPAVNRAARFAHEPGFKMLFPLGSLAVGAVFSGYFYRDIFLGAGGSFAPLIVSFPSHTLENSAEFAPLYLKLLPAAFSISGMVSALYVYSMIPCVASTFIFNNKKLLTLLANKWFWDKAYNAAIVRPFLRSGYNVFFKTLDKGIFEWAGPSGVIYLLTRVSRFFRFVHSGDLQNYLGITLVGIWFFFAIF